MGGFTPERARDRRRFLRWVLMSNLERVAAGEPKSLAEYARVKKLSERTLRHWRREAEMSDELENMKRERDRKIRLEALAQSGEVPPELVLDPVLPATADGDVSAAGVVGVAFEKLSQLVVEGDQKAIGMLLSLPVAKAYMDGLAMEYARTFEDVADDELASEILSFVSDEALRAEFDRRLSR